MKALIIGVELSIIVQLALGAGNVGGDIISACPGVAPQWYCPDNYTLSTNNICVMREYANKDYSCTTGYTLCSEGCCKITTTEATKLCKTGTTWDATKGMCVRLVSGPLQQVCPDQYEMCGVGQCCYKKRVQASVTCPADMIFNVNQCEKYSTYNPSWSCPAGYTLTKSLPDVQYVYDKKSKADVQQILSEGEGICYKTTQTAATLACPAGTKSVTDSSAAAIIAGSTLRCETQVTTRATATCAVGYAYDSSRDTCVWNVYTDPLSVQCESGFVQDGSGCVAASSSLKGAKTTTSAAKVTCPIGFVAQTNGKCLLEEFSVASYSCPAGTKATSDGKNCTSTQTSGPMYSCNSSQSLVGSSTCVSADFLEVGWSCPAGGTYSEVVSEGKLSVSQRLKCKKGDVASLALPSGAEIYDDCKVYSYIIRSCNLTIAQDALFSCPTGSVICAQGCCEQSVTAGTLVCPQGTIPREDACLTEELSLPSYTCSGSLTLDGDKCLEVNTGLLKVSCPTGFTANVNSVCEKVNMENIKPLCPTNYMYNSSSGMCTCIIATTPNVVAAATPANDKTTTKKDDSVGTNTINVWATVSTGGKMSSQY